MMETQISASIRRSGARWRNHICDAAMLAVRSLAVPLLPAVAPVEAGPPLTSFRAECAASLLAARTCQISGMHEMQTASSLNQASC